MSTKPSVEERLAALELVVKSMEDHLNSSLDVLYEQVEELTPKLVRTISENAGRWEGTWVKHNYFIGTTYPFTMMDYTAVLYANQANEVERALITLPDEEPLK